MTKTKTKTKRKAVGVVVLPDSTISTIGKLHDNISNNQSASLGKWAFECKIYRDNPASSTPVAKTDVSGPVPGANASTFLFTMVASQDPRSSIHCVIDDTSTVLTGDFEKMLKTQLQSLWLLRQTTRADGRAYSLNNGEVVLRMANMFVQGGFKGLVLQLETEVEDEFEVEGIEGSEDPKNVTQKESHKEALERINKVLLCYELSTIDTVVYSDMDLAKVYANALGGTSRKG